MALPVNKEELLIRLDELEAQGWDLEKRQGYANDWKSYTSANPQALKMPSQAAPEATKQPFLSTEGVTIKPASGESTPAPGILQRTKEGFQEGVDIAQERGEASHQAFKEGKKNVAALGIEQAQVGLQKMFLPISRAVMGITEPLDTKIIEEIGDAKLTATMPEPLTFLLPKELRELTVRDALTSEPAKAAISNVTEFVDNLSDEQKRIMGLGLGTVEALTVPLEAAGIGEAIGTAGQLARRAAPLAVAAGKEAAETAVVATGQAARRGIKVAEDVGRKGLQVAEDIGEGVTKIKKVVGEKLFPRGTDTVNELGRITDIPKSLVLEAESFGGAGAVPESLKYMESVIRKTDTPIKTFDDLRIAIKADAQPAITRRNLVIDELDEMGATINVADITKVLDDFADELDKTGLGASTAKAMRKEAKAMNDSLGVSKVLTLKEAERRKELLNELLSKFLESKTGKGDVSLADANVKQAMDKLRAGFRKAIEDVAETTEFFGEIKELNQVYKNFKDSERFLANISFKARKGVEAPGAFRESLSDIPILGDIVKKKGVTKANELEADLADLVEEIRSKDLELK